MRAFANDKGADLDKREGFDGNQNHTEGILATKEILFEIDARIQMGSILQNIRHRIKTNLISNKALKRWIGLPCQQFQKYYTQSQEFISWFLAVQNSSIGDLVTEWVSE